MTEDRTELRKHHVTFLLILAIAVSVLFFGMISDFIVALLLAAIFAGLSYPLYTRALSWFGGREGLAATLTLLVVMVCVIVPVFAFLAVVAHEAMTVTESAEPWIKQHVGNPDGMEQILDKAPFGDRLAPYKGQIIQKSGELTQKFVHFAAGGLAGLTQGTARFFLLLFVFLYAKFQFLVGGDALPKRIVHYLPMTREEARRTLSTFTSVTRATLIGAAVIGVIQGTLAGIALAVAGIHGVFLWTAIMCVMSVVPGIGTAIVWVPAVIYLAVEGRFGAAAGLALWCILVVGSVDNFLRPLVVGKQTQLPNLLVLLGTLGGLFFFGPVGIILGPVVAALFVTVWELYASSSMEAPAAASASGSA